MSVQRKTVLFVGRVQGVGFRQTVVNLAHRRPLAGTIRNLPDGRVELILEGPPASINILLEDIRSHFRGYITGARENVEPPTGMEPPVRIAW